MKTMTYHCLKQCESLYYEVNCLNISFLMTNENNVVFFSDKIKKIFGFKNDKQTSMDVR